MIRRALTGGSRFGDRLLRSLKWKGSPAPHPAVLDDGDLDSVVRHLAATVNAAKGDGRAFWVTSRRVFGLYRNSVFEPLMKATGAPRPVLLPDGEDRKTQRELDGIFDKLLADRADRRDLIVAVGGGVVTDMAGFAAATFKRGIAWMSVPTTLTGQVDAAIGGKTGIDYGAGKNMIGAFWQPRLVFLAPVFLQTLTPRDLRCGLTEAVKTGVALDRALLRQIESSAGQLLAGDHRALVNVVRRCAVEKLTLTAADPLDQGPRAALNLGHTAGHAIEAAGGFRRWNHGESVALGLMVILSFARERGKMTDKDRDRVMKLIARMGLAPRTRPAPKDAAPYLTLDKKMVGRHVTVVVPGPLGTTTQVSIDPAELLEPKHWSWT